MTHFKNFRRNHLQQCTVARRVTGNKWEESQYQRSGKFHLNTHWPPLFHYRVNQDIDHTQTKLPDGRVNWAIYKESQKIREKRKLIAAVRSQVEEEHGKRQRLQWYNHYQEEELQKILDENNADYKARLTEKVNIKLRTEFQLKYDNDLHRLEEEKLQIKRENEDVIMKLQRQNEDLRMKMKRLEDENKSLRALNK